MRSIGFQMLDDQVPYRRIAKSALDQWFRQADRPPSQRVPIRQGRRNDQIRYAIAPLEGRLAKRDFERIAHALGLAFGSEAMISSSTRSDSTYLQPRRPSSTPLDGCSPERSPNWLTESRRQGALRPRPCGQAAHSTDDLSHR
jgi:hypothetical protein